MRDTDQTAVSSVSLEEIIKMSRRLFLVATSLLLLASTPFLAHASPKGKKIAYLATGTTHPFIAALSKAFTEKATALGMEVTTFSTPFDAALQAQQVDDAIARKFDLLAVIPASEQAIIPALTRAKQAKIPVVLINTPSRSGTEDLYVSFVGEDHVQLGRIAGEAVLRALKEGGRDGGKVALITGSLHEGVGPRRVSGFREVIRQNPKVEIVAVEDAKWDTAASERIAGQLYARFAPRGGLDVVYGMADNQAVAAIRAADAAGIPLGVEKGKLIVVGSNCLKQGIDMIKAGKQYGTGIQIPSRTGQRAAEIIAAHFEGKPLQKHEYLPVDLVTRANLDKWGEVCSW
jgi:ABC-type sugar transport system substrate-binding protein